MKIGIVTGHVWATKKEPALNGFKLMVVNQIDAASEKQSQQFVAADMVGAGIGEKVLVVSGSTARKSVGRDDVPVDDAIVGIIDSIEMAGGK